MPVCSSVWCVVYGVWWVMSVSISTQIEPKTALNYLANITIDQTHNNINLPQFMMRSICNPFWPPVGVTLSEPDSVTSCMDSVQGCIDVVCK